MKYYWCVNCGYHGDFGFERQRNVKCEKCEYEDICEFDKEEYDEGRKQKGIKDESDS